MNTKQIIGPVAVGLLLGACAWKKDFPVVLPA
jgi:hypothetical protein